MVSLSGEEMKYNIGDLFISGKDTLLYVSGFSCGPSELKDNEYGEYYQLTFLNGKQAGRKTWVEDIKINKLILDGTYKHIPAIKEIE